MESTIRLTSGSSTAKTLDRSAVIKAFRRNILKVNTNTDSEKLTAFKRITHADMETILPYLIAEEGRTTDFSYGGILMWVDCFKYEYAIVNDTLFIKGVLENDLSMPAFSLPVGKMSIGDSIRMIREYCSAIGIKPELSAVPEYAMEKIRELGISNIEELSDWGDYLYDAKTLASLQGKKMGKKRNHVNKFDALYPDHHLEPLTVSNVQDAISFMDEIDLEGDHDGMADEERKMTRILLRCLADGDRRLLGAILYVHDEVAAFTIGDIKHDTLFVHVEKASLKFEGSYEKINKEFASMICGLYPGVKYINREDDSGDPGLRYAKQSYHPLTILRKYNIAL